MSRLEAACVAIDKQIDRYSTAVDRVAEASARWEASKEKLADMQADSIEARRVAWANRNA